MTTFHLYGHTLVLKYLYNNNGSPYYQRQIPTDLQSRFGKAKFSIKLDPAEGPPMIQVERLSKSHTALFKALRANPDLAISEEKLAAMALLQSFGLAPGEGDPTTWEGLHEDAPYPPHFDAFHEQLEEDDRRGKLTNVQKVALKALRGELPLMLSDVPEVYFRYHPRGREEAWREKQLQHWRKLIDFKGDIPLKRLTREDARQFIEHREQQGLKPQSIQKETNIIKAMIEAVIRETSLAIKNPFSSLKITNTNGGEGRREPFSLEELRHILTKGLLEPGATQRIALLCALTGARIGEIVGLRKVDCNLDGEVPYISIRPYGSRRLKTANSTRDVPLVAIAQDLVKQQIDAVGESQALFPQYNDLKDQPRADAASSAVSKWLKAIVESGKTAHSFRHSMSDLLRDANVTEDLREELLGHGKQRIADLYGWGASMQRKVQAIMGATNPIVGNLVINNF